MATLDKNPLTQQPDANATKSAERAASVFIDKGKLQHQNDCHNADLEMAAELQAHWAARVQAEHRIN